MKRYLCFFALVLYLNIPLFAAPTSLMRNNLITSQGTVINDGPSPLLSNGIPDNILYTSILDYLVQQSITIADAGTLNIVLKSGHSFKTGPWVGPSLLGQKNYYPGVKGLPDSIAKGTDQADKNAYSHLQIGQSALGSSMWFLFEKNDIRIDAYRNMNQLLEPANPIPLGFNLDKMSGTAGNIYLGTGFYVTTKYTDSNPPIAVVHRGPFSAQVVFGGKSAPDTSGHGAHVKGDLNITGQIFGKIGAVKAYNRSTPTVIMQDDTSQSSHSLSDTYSYETAGTDPYMPASNKSHRITLPLRFNSSKPLVNVTTASSYRNWYSDKNLNWNNDDYDFKNETAANLNGFILAEIGTEESPLSQEILHMQLFVEEIDSTTYTKTFNGSTWSVFEFGEQSSHQTFVCFMPFTALPGKQYRFYFLFLKWRGRDGVADHSKYPITVTSTNFIMYVLPAVMQQQ